MPTNQNVNFGPDCKVYRKIKNGTTFETFLKKRIQGRLLIEKKTYFYKSADSFLAFITIDSKNILYCKK